MECVHSTQSPLAGVRCSIMVCNLSLSYDIGRQYILTPYPIILIAAVKRKYEALRRTWKSDDKEDCDEIPQSVNRHVHVLFQSLYILQKFENCAVVVQEGEMRYWKQLALEYMGKESDDPDDTSRLVIHQPPW